MSKRSLDGSVRRNSAEHTGRIAKKREKDSVHDTAYGREAGRRLSARLADSTINNDGTIVL